MPFPRKLDNSLDFAAYERLDGKSQEALLDELEKTGTPAEHKQAFNYFEKQENDAKEAKRQHNEGKAILHSKITAAEQREAKYRSELVTTMVTSLQSETNSSKNKCVVS